MKPQRKEDKVLMTVGMIVSDEISMAPKAALEAVYSLLKDLMQNEEPTGRNIMILEKISVKFCQLSSTCWMEDHVEACV
ncbi:hypothetical protein GCK32_000189 [Trichostrongylus colubriformis]|uniref:Uncharacterized protein n=1 Tax=Trichostrongylus colubriformis TaxID=6319 RepID=A0AAN8ESG0_TRICO